MSNQEIIKSIKERLTEISSEKKSLILKQEFFESAKLRDQERFLEKLLEELENCDKEIYEINYNFNGNNKITINIKDTLEELMKKIIK